MRRYRNFTVLFQGSSEGGEEALVIHHPSGSAIVATTWGSDYGGGIDVVYSLPKGVYNNFSSIKFTGSYECFKWLEANCKQYIEKPIMVEV